MSSGSGTILLASAIGANAGAHDRVCLVPEHNEVEAQERINVRHR
jgi:hypothetical protein